MTPGTPARMDFPVWFWVVIPLAAVAPSWGTLGAGLVAAAMETSAAQTA